MKIRYKDTQRDKIRSSAHFLAQSKGWPWIGKQRRPKRSLCQKIWRIGQCSALMVNKTVDDYIFTRIVILQIFVPQDMIEDLEWSALCTSLTSVGICTEAIFPKLLMNFCELCHETRQLCSTYLEDYISARVAACFRVKLDFFRSCVSAFQKRLRLVRR